MLRPSVLFMTSLLSAWRDMNRGLAMRGFNLIDLCARDVSALTDVIAGDEILETAFRLGGSKPARSEDAGVGADWDRDFEAGH